MLGLPSNTTRRLLQTHLQARCSPCLVDVTTRSFAKQKAAAATSKKKQQAAAAATPTAETGRDKNLELILASLNAPKRTEPELSQKEKARRYDIGRNYVIGRFQQHNALHHDLTCKIHLKKHAVKMLPRNSKVKQEAMNIDSSGPPPWRHIARWTPPIPDFDPTPFLEKND